MTIMARILWRYVFCLLHNMDRKNPGWEDWLLYARRVDVSGLLTKQGLIKGLKLFLAIAPFIRHPTSCMRKYASQPPELGFSHVCVPCSQYIEP